MTYESPTVDTTGDKECDDEGIVTGDDKTSTPINDIADELTDDIMLHLVKIVESDDYSVIVQSSK